MSRKISIVLSTYNESKIIENTVNKIFNNIENVEIILVDDNSNDGTIDRLKNINNENLKIFRRKQRGLASAFLLGIINSTGEYVGWTDSNMPDLIKHFDEMEKKLNEFDFVLLSRYIEGGGDRRSKLRIFSSKILNSFCRLVLGNEIKDYTSGIFLMKREVLEKGVPIAYGHGEFFIEFLYNLKKHNLKILELAYIQPPDEEGSKTASSLFRFFILGVNYFLRILIARFRIN